MTSLPSPTSDDRVAASIDVAKATLEVAISGRASALAFTNDKAGCAALLAELRDLNVGLVLVGGHRRLRAGLRHCAAAGGAGGGGGGEQPAPGARLRPRHGYLAKTDCIDSAVLADMARTLLARGDLSGLVAGAGGVAVDSSDGRHLESVNASATRWMLLR